MKAILLLTVLLFSFLLNSSKAQKTEIIKDKGLRLTIVTKDSTFSEGHRQALIRVFFTAYPKMRTLYNPRKGAKNVTFIIDPAYDGVAGTEGAVITYSQKYMRGHRQDIDVATHELMHVVQDYKESVGPGWLTEGIADYVRDQFGLNNAGAGWSLGNYMPGQNYDNGYNVTARFLKWIELNKKNGFVKEINERLRKHNYKDSDWKMLTGNTVEELWKEYIKK